MDGGQWEVVDDKRKEGPAFLIVGLGELLWDLLPDGKQLGGAPANFAYHAALLGDRGAIASRLGDDALGAEARDLVSNLRLPLEHLQTDADHPTGTVQIEISPGGEPDFTIVPDVAWDFLAWTPRLEELASQADVVCFGSLAQRSPRSRQTIRAFLDATRHGALRIFDVNLRQAYYSAEVLTESLRRANVVKLNDEELPILLERAGLRAEDDQSGVMRLLEAFELDLVCVTRGARGSLLASRSEVVDHPGLETAVADTVGAGDAFTAAMAHHLLRGAPLRRLSEAANRLGAWVAGQVGATPAADPAIVAQVTGV